METDNPFEKVLDRLREKGWHKGSLGSTLGPNCIYGAAVELRLTQGIDGLIPVIRSQFPDRLVQMPDYHHPGPTFNDHPDTTFSDVERVLEKAAVKWEEERVLRDD